MNQLKRLSALILALVFLSALPTYAKSGDIGYFGGITEGRRLPKTTELLLSSTKVTDMTEFVYKEIIFLTGRPAEFEGLLNVRYSGSVTDTSDTGTYTVTYQVTASDTTSEGINISRNLTYLVNWRRAGSQIIKDYDVRTWRETITIDGTTYTLDPRQSYQNISIIEDHTAAVTYYRGDVSQRAVYTSADNDQTINEVYGSFYGYDSAWSSTETHRLDGTIYNRRRADRRSEYADIWQLQYQVRPSVSVYKTLQYTANEPTLISFDGNYKEVLINESGLFYDIFISPHEFSFDSDKTGQANIDSFNVFEQLIAPDLTFLTGHPARADIEKLFAMQVLEGEPKFYVPSQAITRAQFTTALVKALKLPLIVLAEQNTGRGRQRTNTNPTIILFPDVPQTDPSFDYITTAYMAGIARGGSRGMFYADSPIETQEAVAMMVRSLGLVNLSPDPTPMTLFSDDDDIAGWARRELYAAERIGLIAPDSDGNINPKNILSKAEAAALLNHLIEYMRADLVLDYADRIVNITY